MSDRRTSRPNSCRQAQPSHTQPFDPVALLGVDYTALTQYPLFPEARQDGRRSLFLWFTFIIARADTECHAGLSDIHTRRCCSRLRSQDECETQSSSMVLPVGGTALFCIGCSEGQYSSAMSPQHEEYNKVLIGGTSMGDAVEMHGHTTLLSCEPQMSTKFGYKSVHIVGRLSLNHHGRRSVETAAACLSIFNAMNISSYHRSSCASVDAYGLWVRPIVLKMKIA